MKRETETKTGIRAYASFESYAEVAVMTGRAAE
jgi:hypothetical protein